MLMLKGRSAMLSAGLLFALAGLNPAHADVPAAMDRVPQNAGMIFAVRNMEGIRSRFDDLAKKLNIPQDDMDSDNPMGMAKKLLATEGVNKDGSLAVAMLTNDKGQIDFDAPEEEQDLVIIVPVTDFAKFARAMGATDTTGIAAIQVDEQPAFVKDIGGGYAAMSKDKDVAEKFEGKGGNAAAHTKNLGKSGQQIADKSDVLVVVSVAAMKDKIDEGVASFKENAQGMAAMAQQGGEQAVAMIQMFQDVAEAFARDGQVGIAGFGLGEAGVSIDFGAQFKEGTPSAKFLSSTGNSSTFLARVPNQPFFMAMAMDFSNPGVKKFYKEMGKLNEQNPMGNIGMAGLAENIDKTDGMGFVMGANKAGIMGLLANTVSFISTSDPAGYVATTSKSFKDMNGKEMEGIKFSVDYKPAAQEVAGVKADSWSMQMTADEDNPQAGGIQMMQQMLFGADGLGGMIAPVDNGVVMTMSQNTPLFTNAVEAAKSGKGLAEDAGIKAVQEHLPSNRMFEMYLGTKSIMEAVNSFAMMMGGGADIKIPEKVSHVGMAVGTEAGGANFRLFVPMDVITTVADVAKSMQQGGEDEDMEDDEAPEGDQPSNPRF